VGVNYNTTQGINSPTTNPLANGSTTTRTFALPAGILPGMFMLAWLCSTAGPGTAWTAPSGFAGTWTNLIQKNATASVGGQIALFSYIYQQGDPMTATFGGNTLGSLGVMMMAFPTTGTVTATATDLEKTSSATSITIPQFSPPNQNDLRMILHCSASSGAPLTPGAETSQAGNVFERPFSLSMWNFSNTLGCQCYTQSLQSVLDAGTQSWTCPSTQFYDIFVTLADGLPNGPTVAEDQDAAFAIQPIIPTGMLDLTSTQIKKVAGPGDRGGGISIF
jgi:hypothetical protein